MLRHKNINKICWVVVSLTIVVAILFMTASSLGWIKADTSIGYENRLFDTSRVHTIDIVMDDWEGFLETATREEYSPCTIVIDGEKYSNIGIRGKGNTSLSQVAAYGNDRYSFKVEFDQYNTGGSYYGLDKLSLNNIYADNTYMKDYLSYQMMEYVGAASPLCSFVYITVNGKDWGLYLAVEGIEESFLQRNYGKDYGELYKPDSMNMGGGRGNGAGFNIEDFMNEADSDRSNDGIINRPGNFDPSMMPEGAQREGFDPSTMMPEGAQGEGFDPSTMFGEGNFGGAFGGRGSSDVYLQYIDDSPESYPNIFGSAKTDITDADKNRLIASLKQLSEGEAINEVVDVDAVIKYFVAHTFLCNSDSYTGTMVHNYYLYEKDGVLTMLPWDYNLAFGGMNMGMGMGRSNSSVGATSEINSPIDSPVTGGDMESRPMVAWIFENEEYTALYHQYYTEFIRDYFDSGFFEQMLDETVNMISPYVEKDPTAFCTYEEFLTGVQTLREFCLLRAESISGQLDGTIPSTRDGQSADNSTLIDASHINITDMGTMSGGGGGFGWGGNNGSDMGNMPGRNEMPPSEAPSFPGGTEQTDQGAERPSNAAPSMPDGAGQPSDTAPSMPSGSGQQPNGGRRGRENFDASAMTEGFDPSVMFGGTSPSNTGVSTATQWMLVGGSVFLLLVGLFVVKKYRH
ncbi:spore coat protein CotH [Anaerotaenia torta]|uniref:CotH kinase family protein n=1 Tax=Anaerotaenia torta TaxID=433293 RepID=UPI003D1A3F90